MTDRLDRVEAICSRNAEAIEVNTEAIKVLIEATQTVSQRTVAITEMMQSVEVHRQEVTERLSRSIADGESRFETMLAEARADREVTERLSRSIADGESRFETMLAEARADRIEWRRHIEAQNQVIQGLLVQMANTNSRIDRLEDS